MIIVVSTYCDCCASMVCDTLRPVRRSITSLMSSVLSGVCRNICSDESDRNTGSSRHPAKKSCRPATRSSITDGNSCRPKNLRLGRAGSGLANNGGSRSGSVRGQHFGKFHILLKFCNIAATCLKCFDEQPG